MKSVMAHASYQIHLLIMKQLGFMVSVRSKFKFGPELIEVFPSKLACISFLPRANKLGSEKQFK